MIIQGRGDYDQWVTKVKISYSLDGKTWKYVDNGKVFDASTDVNTKVRIKFGTPVRARTLRINIIEFNALPCLRFDAVYISLS